MFWSPLRMCNGFARIEHTVGRRVAQILLQNILSPQLCLRGKWIIGQKCVFQHGCILHLEEIDEILPQIVVCRPINSLPHFLRKFLFVPALRKLGSIWQNGRCNTSQARETRNLFKSYQYNVGCDDLMHQFWCKFIQGEQIELANRDMRLPRQNSGWNSTRPVFILKSCCEI